MADENIPLRAILVDVGLLRFQAIESVCQRLYRDIEGMNEAIYMSCHGIWHAKIWPTASIKFHRELVGCY